MALDQEKAQILHDAAEMYLSHKSILIEPGQPQLTGKIDTILNRLKRVMVSNIDPIHREQGVSLRNKLVEVYDPLFTIYPADLVIATGVITSFEQLHPYSDKLAKVSEIRQLTLEASRNWGDDFKLPTLLDVHGLLYGLNYIIRNFPAK